MDGRWNWLMIDVNGISPSHRRVCTHIQMIAVVHCLIPAPMKLTVMMMMMMMIALCDQEPDDAVC